MPSPEMLLTEAWQQEKIDGSGNDGDCGGEDDGLFDQGRPGMLSVHKEPPERFEIFLLILSQDGTTINSRNTPIGLIAQNNVTNFVKFVHTF